MGCGASTLRETVAEVPAAVVALVGIALRTLQTKVKKSAELLDKQVPGWHQHIDLNVLDMNLPNKCIVGQLANLLPNHDNVKKLDMMDELRAFHVDSTKDIINAGKVVSDHTDYNGNHALLTRLWRRQVSVRRNKVKKLQKELKRVNKELGALGV